VLHALGAPTSIEIGKQSLAAGKTLVDLNLRGVTGATVVAVTRDGVVRVRTRRIRSCPVIGSRSRARVRPSRRRGRSSRAPRDTLRARAQRALRCSAGGRVVRPRVVRRRPARRARYPRAARHRTLDRRLYQAADGSPSEARGWCHRDEASKLELTPPARWARSPARVVLIGYTDAELSAVDSLRLSGSELLEAGPNDPPVPTPSWVGETALVRGSRGDRAAHRQLACADHRRAATNRRRSATARISTVTLIELDSNHGSSLLAPLDDQSWLLGCKPRLLPRVSRRALDPAAQRRVSGRPRWWVDDAGGLWFGGGGGQLDRAKLEGDRIVITATTPRTLAGGDGIRWMSVRGSIESKLDLWVETYHGHVERYDGRAGSYPFDFKDADDTRGNGGVTHVGRMRSTCRRRRTP